MVAKVDFNKNIFIFCKNEIFLYLCRRNRITFNLKKDNMSLFWIIVAVIYGIGLVTMIISYVTAQEVPPELEDLF